MHVGMRVCCRMRVPGPGTHLAICILCCMCKCAQAPSSTAVTNNCCSRRWCYACMRDNVTTTPIACTGSLSSHIYGQCLHGLHTSVLMASEWCPVHSRKLVTLSSPDGTTGTTRLRLPPAVLIVTPSASLWTHMYGKHLVWHSGSRELLHALNRTCTTSPKACMHVKEWVRHVWHKTC